jgi:hypothetical protein
MTDKPHKAAAMRKLAAEVLPKVDSQVGKKITRAQIDGTTTRDDEVTVLWVGKHLALFHTVGTNCWSGQGSTSYYPSTVTVVAANPTHNRRGLNPDIWWKLKSLLKMPDEADVEVWEGAKGKRLTGATLQALVERALVMDKAWPKAVALGEEEAEQAQNRKEEEELAREAARQEVIDDKLEATRLATDLVQLAQSGQWEGGEGRAEAARLAELVLKRGLGDVDDKE